MKKGKTAPASANNLISTVNLVCVVDKCFPISDNAVVLGWM